MFRATGANELTIVFNDEKVSIEAILKDLKKGGVSWQGQPVSMQGNAPAAPRSAPSSPGAAHSASREIPRYK